MDVLPFVKMLPPKLLVIFPLRYYISLRKTEVCSMSAQQFNQLPLSFSEVGKRDVRTQFAALCYRVVKGKTKVLLITSRGTGRWIIPKGWPQSGEAPHQVVLNEAWEEAGVKGAVKSRPVGIFSYVKDMDEDENLPCVAMVYAVEVTDVLDEFPEQGQRKRKWMSPKKAASRVDAPELAEILLHLDFDNIA
ncbi:MAG: NUDIX hydrolase [Paracoccaceae bacterium]